MKPSYVLAIMLIGVLSLSQVSHAGNPIVGVVGPVSQERITVLIGDKAAVSLGTKDGLVKGDIGLIATDRSRKPDAVIGKCVITETGYDSSVCELIKARKEIELGSYISFDPILFDDGNYYSLAMNTLSSVVEPYQPYDRLRVCIYGFFDSQNATTGLSEQITMAFKRIFSQKNRIELVSKEVLRNLVIYPDAAPDLISYTKYQMKRNDIDVLILGHYTISDRQIDVTLQKVDKNGQNKTIVFSFPAQTNYTALSSNIILTPQEVTKAQTIPCNIALRSTPRLLQREERTQLIKNESAGNPLIEQALRRIDFNIVGPVDVRATIDGDTVAPVTKEGHGVMLSTGTHAMATSFRRGYFFNETLLYTSDQEVIKEAVLDLTKDKGLVIEIRINASLPKDPISLAIYQPTDRKRQVLKPIYGVESDKTVDIFRD
jgi:hypothetical protein